MRFTSHKFLTQLFLILIFAISHSQNSGISPVLISREAINADVFCGYDSFGYLYQIKNNVFSKIKGKEIFEYKNVSLGKITKVDLQNPLKIVLFYEDFNSVILLDNQLNKMSEINFSQNPNPINASAVGMSTQNQLWIYNTLNQQIGLFDYLKNEYKTISIPLTEPIKYYQTDFNIFYWIDKKNQWYSCDIFGKITALGKIPEFDKIEIVSSSQYLFSIGDQIYFSANTKADSDTFSEIKILEKSFDKFYYKDQILSIFTFADITNYKIVTP
ncbi:hypothetical protein [Flavobacterium foetidum]|uniref:hypothetical protein n=1 Tax=Flavobacterium foetidum TaxID=2026681 RepID=UPI00107501D2|nr:hypothetical protein [Flavobacterium foetidum]KAF2512645.1 hypothetical protein E0W73_16030 [Flavobacterium foetidum]